MDKFEKLNRDAKKKMAKVESKEKKINRTRSKSISHAEAEGKKFFAKMKKM